MTTAIRTYGRYYLIVGGLLGGTAFLSYAAVPISMLLAGCGGLNTAYISVVAAPYSVLAALIRLVGWPVVLVLWLIGRMGLGDAFMPGLNFFDTGVCL